MQSETIEQMGNVPELLADAAGTERRERILAAAWQVLSQVGFEKITTRRIAEAAGINIATLHYHFGSKEAVLTETLRYAQRWADTQMRMAIAGSKSPADALARAFAETLRLMILRPGVLRFDLVVRAFRDEESRQEALRVYGTYQRFVREIVDSHVASGGRLAPDLTAQSLAEYMVSVVDGVALHHRLTGDDDAAERSLYRIKTHVWQLMGLSQSSATTGIGDVVPADGDRIV